MDLTTDQKPKQQTLGCLRVGKRALGLHASTKLPVKPLNDVGGAKRFPLTLGKTVKGEQLLPAFLQTCSNLRGQPLPLQDKFPIVAVPVESDIFKYRQLTIGPQRKV